jgi:4-alpha-glucanotransferase
MSETRTSGILLHPTSLPSRWGIGDLGASAYAFVDFLHAAGQQLWQVMPLGPTGYGDSPYQSFSSFAGNPLLVSPERLLEQGLLTAEDVADAPSFPADAVDYGAVIPYKQTLMRRAFSRFLAGADPDSRAAFESFRAERSLWLDDYALFMALKQTHGGAWPDWEPAIARHDPEAVSHASHALATEVTFQAFAQFLFFQQWEQLRRYANERGIRIIGDIPIFVAYDSADVWGSRELFHIGEDNRPTVVAGVPPDYFSATGQLWGNPLYRWDALAQQDYRWWIERLRAVFSLVDVVRLDHFRGFAAFWEVPASEETAINGAWVPGPGAALFEAARAALGDLPIIAEDLGVITPDVEELRDGFGFPGMKVLQFAFGGSPDAEYLPHNYGRRCVVYTGTHDNDTTLGWWRTLDDTARRHVQLYLGRSGDDIGWDLIRLALASVADSAVVPLQDVLKLGSEARMNTPGRPGGNWSWRVTETMLDQFVAERLQQLTELYGRMPAPPEGAASGDGEGS